MARQTPRGAIGFRAAPIGFVHFHGTLQTFAAGTHHRPAQLVEHRPRCPVTAQTQHSLQAEGADAVFLTGHKPHRRKPNFQGQLGVLKNGARQHRGLMPTSLAQPQTFFHRPSQRAVTTWAAQPCRPAQLPQIPQTIRFLGKTLIQFQPSARIIFVHARKHYPLCLVESGAYPYDFITTFRRRTERYLFLKTVK
jgi:hypothetical protein